MAVASICDRAAIGPGAGLRACATALVAGATLALAGPAAADHCGIVSQLSGAEIHAELTGRKLSGFSVRTDAHWTERLYRNGFTDFQNAKGESTFGRWKVEGRRLCFSYGTLTQWSCKTVHRVAKTCDGFSLALIDEAGEVTSGIYGIEWLEGAAQTDTRRAEGSELERAIAREKGWNTRTREGVQNALIWTGDYNGRLDGDFGPRTRAAIKAFQRREGQAETGYLTEAQIDRLEAARLAAIAAAGFRIVEDTETGLRIGLPLGLFEREKRDGSMVIYRSKPGRPEGNLALISFPGSGADLKQVFAQLLAETSADPNRYTVLKDDWFVISETSDGVSSYAYAKAEHGAVKGFLLTWAENAGDEFRPIATAMFNSFESIPGLVLQDTPPAAQPDRRAERRDRAADPARRDRADHGGGKVGDQRSADADPRRQPSTAAAARETVSTGTGFVIDRAGHVLTNAHVVEGCAALAVDDGLPASAIAVDAGADLALMLAPEAARERVAAFAPDSLRLNADVTVIGFPLHGILGGLNVTRGSVSALSGLGNDTKYFQISAAIQPGNSGGPVLNRNGAVVGVVQSKLDAVKIAEITGDIPQNINFAIRGELAKRFLAKNGVRYEVDRQPVPQAPADLAERARGFTVLVRCLE